MKERDILMIGFENSRNVGAKNKKMFDNSNTILQSYLGFRVSFTFVGP